MPRSPLHPAPLLLLLAAAILIPTTCILWLVSAALDNEQLAVRQRLTDVYTQQLDTVRRNLNDDLAQRIHALAGAQHFSAPIRFSQVVHFHIADSILILDPNGGIVYPLPTAFVATDTPPPANWDNAQRLELTDPTAAAAQWKSLAAAIANPNWKAAALRNQARALANAHQIPAAINILAIQLQAGPLIAATDPSSSTPHLIAPAALLRALQLRIQFPQAGGDLSTAQITGELWDWLERYDLPLIPSPQRLFLLQQFHLATRENSPLLSAETLAAPFAEDPARNPLPSSLKPDLTRLDTLYALVPPPPPPTSDEQYLTSVALLRPETVRTIVDAATAKASVPSNVQIVLHPESAHESAFLDLPAGELLPNFRLALFLNGNNPFAATTARRRSITLWTAALTIVAILSIGLLLALSITRQLRLTRLKNDLIATVSHELKTPLASMRLLVDTLLDHRTTSPEQSRDYLTLIARENTRLSRIIDNFLTFSRMQRNKHRFTFAPVALPDIIHEALAAIPDHASAITTAIEGSPEALTTLLLNLLDNAWKYADAPRHIRLRAWRHASAIHLALSDNGIGIPRRHLRKIFHRFYQVDHSLSRKSTGCGLGLAIVHAIAKAHHATIAVESTPAKGSTFTLVFPAIQTTAQDQQLRTLPPPPRRQTRLPHPHAHRQGSGSRHPPRPQPRRR